MPGEQRAEEERDREDDRDVDPEGRDHRAVVDAGADDHAEPRALDHPPERQADEHRQREDEDAEERVVDRRRRRPRRVSGNCSGVGISSAMPPKWPSTWSAMMIEAAIVISAWRSSWPWFQRRKSCCMTRPMTPTTNEAMTSPRIQSPAARGRRESGCRPAAREAPHDLEGDEAAEHVERPVRHVDDPHEAEDEAEAARDDEVETGEREGVQADEDEQLTVAHGLVGDPGEHERHDEPEHDAAGVAPGLRLEPAEIRAPRRDRGRLGRGRFTHRRSRVNRLPATGGRNLPRPLVPFNARAARRRALRREAQPGR